MNQRRFKIGEEVFTSQGATGKVKEVHTAIVEDEPIYEVALYGGAGVLYIRESQLGSCPVVARPAPRKHGWVKNET